MCQLKINVIKSLNNLSCIYKYHCDILLLLSRQKTDCSPGASQFINYSSSRIFLASKEYLIFGSKTDPLRVINILKDPPGTAGASVVCKRGWFTLQGAGTTTETWRHTPNPTRHRPPPRFCNFSSVVSSLGLDSSNCTEYLRVYTCQAVSAPLWAP